MTLRTRDPRSPAQADRPSTRPAHPLSRRDLLGAALAASFLPARAAEAADVEALLREGGVVMAFRHALAPGTFDPPGFTLADCASQRNLSDEGRAQARRIGAWFRARGLMPASVRSSPWCRCLDTATLAFGDAAKPWPVLGSPRGTGDEGYAESQRTLRRELAAASLRRGRFEVWVTHMFVLTDLVGGGIGSGAGLVLRSGAGGVPRVMAPLDIG